MRIHIPVIHDADGLVVVDKPPRLETSGRTLDDPRSVQFQLAEQLGRPVWAVHQLDRDTSGVLLFVRRSSLVAEWQRRMKPPGRKIYLALVHGSVAWRTRRVEAPLRYDASERRWRVDPGGKRALSVMRRLATPSRTTDRKSDPRRTARSDGRACELRDVVPEPGTKWSARAISTSQRNGVPGGTTGAPFTWVEVELLTGRTHQARVHLAHLGHPLVGERRYREPACALHPRHALHARRIELEDGLRFEAPLPRDLEELAERLELGPG